MNENAFNHTYIAPDNHTYIAPARRVAFGDLVGGGVTAVTSSPHFQNRANAGASTG